MKGRIIMKIGIITINDNNNYGNRLQNYAVYSMVKNYGYSVDTIIVKIKDEVSYRNEKIIKEMIRQVSPPYLFFESVQLMVFIKNKLLGNIAAKKNCIFNRFTASKCSGKFFYINKYKDIHKISSLGRYDYFLTGSDQVWNPYFAGSDYYFLTFAPPQKRIGFIASIGVSELPNEQKERYTRLLNQMQYISVREESAAQMIKELLHKSVDCFPDPVLLLGKENWEELMKPVEFSIPEKYILSFFLGEEPMKKIESYAVGHKLKVVHMNRKEYEKYYLLGPEQLLYMIKNAEIVMTDSFHVTAFSIIFHKQFYVFNRKDSSMKDMFSRMETLLGKFYLSDRIQNEEEIKEKENISKERYIEIDTTLDVERKRFDGVMRELLQKK